MRMRRIRLAGQVSKAPVLLSRSTKSDIGSCQECHIPCVLYQVWFSSPTKSSSPGVCSIGQNRLICLI